MREPYLEFMTETGGLVENSRNHSDPFSGTGLGLCKSMELTARLKILEKLAQLLLLLKGESAAQGRRWKMPFLMLQQNARRVQAFSQRNCRMASAAAWNYL